MDVKDTYENIKRVPADVFELLGNLLPETTKQKLVNNEGKYWQQYV